MSRCYEMRITVGEHRSSKTAAIIDAVAALGYDVIDADNESPPGRSTGKRISFGTETITVVGGQTDEDVAREVHEAIWKANDGFCVVNVMMRDMDAEVPCYTGTEHEYEERNSGR